MYKTIARKEFQEMMRDGRFRWTAGLVLLLLVASLALGWQHYRETSRERAVAQAASRAQWDNQGKRNPHTAAHFGVYAFKPPTPLSLVDRGIEAYTGEAVWLEAHYQNPFRYRPAEDRTAVGRFAELTAATVLQLLVPLVIILLTFSAFAGEREAGTLRQLLSVGVRQRELVTGKMLGIIAALALLLVPASLLGTLALALASGWGAPLSGSAPRMALMTVGYLLYFGAFLGLSLAVSAWARSSRVALVVLLAFWIVNGLLAPRATSDLAERIYRVPTAGEFWAQISRDMREGVDGHDPADARREALKQRTLAKYGVEKVEQLPVSFDGLALQAGEEHGNEVFDRRYGELWSLYQKQEWIHRAGAIIAPLLAARSFSMSLAGTDTAEQKRFATAAEAHRRLLNKMMNDTLTYNSRTGDFNYFRDSDLWRQVPEFKYQMVGAGQALKEQGWSLSLLAAWCFAALGGAVWAANRMKI